MKRAHLLAVFAVVAAVQWAVPASMIISREVTLRTGRLFKFRTAPVDPFDAFRGRFVALRVEQDSAPLAAASGLQPGQLACAWVAADSDGFAVLTGASAEPPADQPYIRARVTTCGDRVSFALPLDRFYMNEKLAPAAEQAYLEHARASGPRDAWIAVRVRKGQAVIEDLYLGGHQIEDVLKAEARD
jgi:hypothetical protein